MGAIDFLYHEDIFELEFNLHVGSGSPRRACMYISNKARVKAGFKVHVTTVRILHR